MRNRLISMAFLLTVAPALFAHEGPHAIGFSAGLSHPFTGLDHLLAMVAVGLLAVRCAHTGARHALWQVPAAFVGSMVVGSVFAILGIVVPGVEMGVALSVLAFGVLIALTSTPRPAVAALAVGLFGLLHGQAHGSELQGAFGTYAAGFVVATSVLHAVGITLGMLLAQIFAHQALPLRLTGGALVAASALLVAGLL